MNENSRRWTTSVLEDFPEYSARLNPAQIHPDSTYYDLENHIVISFQRLQHVPDAKKYLSETVSVLTSGDMLLLTCAGPLAEDDGSEYFQVTTMDELREWVGLDANFVDWNLIYSRDNRDLFLWAVLK